MSSNDDGQSYEGEEASESGESEDEGSSDFVSTMNTIQKGSLTNTYLKLVIMECQRQIELHANEDINQLIEEFQNIAK